MEGKLVKIPICKLEEMQLCGYCLHDNRDILKLNRDVCRKEWIYLCPDCLKKHHYTDVDGDWEVESANQGVSYLQQSPWREHLARPE